jgi:hypothetical protein
MYTLNLPVSALRTKVRQEFERHRYVAQLPTVDVLLFKSDAEFQETMNYWKQVSHIMKYFRAESDPKARLPNNFISGFLEVSRGHLFRRSCEFHLLTVLVESKLDWRGISADAAKRCTYFKPQ